ncbi:hypothetical protein [Herpetosiphon sp.]|uniref:PH domain-containing protein n=1 Tax=Herpetosiphon aurantiacus (strain ATCC 23779 / DSM 785 / 114-95) TaxID=316274 RepID=A9B237_HERA2|nr:hypothetical protein [Herpetosiphon sp.]ABX07387.1 hypothetical protein Haur_4756 [Herpetosiphon aurantiacus DSM 785]
MQPIIFRARNYKRQLFIMLFSEYIMIAIPIIFKVIFDMKRFPVFFVIMGILYFYGAISDYRRELIIDDQGITVKRLFNPSRTAEWKDISAIQYFMFFNRPIEYILFDRDVQLLDALYPSIVPKPYNRRVLLLNEWDNYEQIKLLAEQKMPSIANKALIVPFTFSLSSFIKQVLVYGVILIPIIIIWG